MAERKLLDISGIPFVVEKRDGTLYVVGIKVRKRDLKFAASAIPVEIVDKIDGKSGNEKIDGIDELENFLDGFGEGEKLGDKVPDGYVSDAEVEAAWEELLSGDPEENE